jgi:alpha-glucosidase
VQFGAFSPILRTHTTKNSDAERRVWAYPEPYSGILRSTFQLREALEPYIYTEARRTYDTGTAFLHPLYYDYPDAQEAYSSKDEYAFGDSMIVAPVTHPVDAVTQLAKQSIWVPAGDWFEWPTGKALNGPATYERSFSVSQEPIYLRSGAILPMQPPMQHTGDKPVDPLILNVWPLTDMHSSSYMLYEDGSDGESYKQGVYALTPVSAVQHGDTLTIEIAPVQGGYPSMLKSRSYELRLPADWPPDSVTVNGIALGLQTADAAAPGWHYEGNTLSTIVHSSSFPVSEAVHIDVRRAPGSLADRAILDGFPGSIARLRSAYDTLNQQFLTQWSPEPHVDSWPPDSLVDAWQTGDRISYRPDTARKELMAFSQKYANAQATVQQMLDSIATLNNGQVAEQFRKKLGHKDIQPANAQQLRTGLERTVAQLNNGNPSR